MGWGCGAVLGDLVSELPLAPGLGDAIWEPPTRGGAQDLTYSESSTKVPNPTVLLPTPPPLLE
jgi:hypothetical protein